MKNLKYERTILEPLAEDPKKFRQVLVEVEFRTFVPHCAALPDSEEVKWALLLQGYLQLDCEARQDGLWADAMYRWKEQGVLEIPDPWKRLEEMDRVMKAIKSLRKTAGHALRE